MQKIAFRIATSIAVALGSMSTDVAKLLNRGNAQVTNKSVAEQIHEANLAMATQMGTAQNLAFVERLKLYAKIAEAIAKIKDGSIEAHAELQKLLDEAAAGAQGAGAAQDWGLGQIFPGAGALAKAAGSSTTKPQAFFDTRLAKQMVGGPQEEQLAQLRKIERNTRHRGGLPVV